MATACSEELNSPFWLRIDCPAGPLVWPGEAQPRKGCSTDPENQTGCEAGGTYRRSSPRSRAPRGCVSNLRAAEAPHGAAAPPRPARQVPAGARPGLGPNFGERPSSPAAPAAPRFSRSLSPSGRGKRPTPPQRASGRCAREAAAARRRRRPLLLLLLLPPPPLRLRAAARSPPSRPPRGGCGAGLPLPLLPPLAAGRAAPVGLAWLAAAARGSA